MSWSKMFGRVSSSNVRRLVDGTRGLRSAEKVPPTTVPVKLRAGRTPAAGKLVDWVVSFVALSFRKPSEPPRTGAPLKLTNALADSSLAADVSTKKPASLSTPNFRFSTYATSTLTVGSPPVADLTSSARPGNGVFLNASGIAATFEPRPDRLNRICTVSASTVVPCDVSVPPTRLYAV